jgi:DNA recombination protein RmuC
MSILDVILILLVVILVVATIFSFWFFYKRLQSHKTDSSLTTDQQQINESIKAIETQLKTIQSNNLTVNSNTDKNFGAIKTTLDSLGNRSEEINKIFLNIKSRGNFGEFQLETLLTDAFGNNSSMVEFQYRIPNSDGIVDAIIKINQQFFLGIDAKFPLENYRHVVNAKNETDRDEYQKKFKRDILNKIKEVQKYISPENHINNIILFIPSENVYSSIIE